VTGTSKRKGDKAELEAAKVIFDLLGYEAVRALGAGRKEDGGDISGVPEHSIQVANWADISRAAIRKPEAVERQRQVAGKHFAATFVRFRGGVWRVVLTPEQWAAYVREVLA
jgi:hypothetical protein